MTRRAPGRGTPGRAREGPPRIISGARLLPLLLVVLAAPDAAAVPDRPHVVQIEMHEFAFRPARIVIPAGRPVRLVFTNRGQIAHQFGTDYLRADSVRIVSTGLLVDAMGLEHLRLQPGGTARLEFWPRRRGRVVYACTIEGHREAGMHGILEIQ